MRHIQQMLEAHPKKIRTDRALLAKCIEACYDCGECCTISADACLAAKGHEELVCCVRVNLDCADVCDTTARLLSRQTEPDWDVIRSQLQACATACDLCAAECKKHVDVLEHCRICAEVCQACLAVCDEILGAVSVAEE